MALAYLLAGNKFEGVQQAALTAEKVYAETEKAALEYLVPMDWLFNWADSLLTDGLITLDLEQQDAVPRKMFGPGFSLMPYQFDQACWSAARLGSVLDNGCGVGKTATACAAVMAAARLGKCKAHRCYIIAPYNALGTWEPYVRDLKIVFDKVVIYSVDSLHHLKGLECDGGAIIFDEVHKCKDSSRTRTAIAHQVRAKFEWCICLTATLLHTGCDAIMSVLDLACPGLSRFIDPMDFGEYFECVNVKEFVKAGRLVTRRSLGLPVLTARERLVHYMFRGVRSLSFESPEVGAYVHVPGQDKYYEDSWPKPAWIEELESSIWIPGTDEWEAFGAVMFAEWEQNGEILLERLATEFNVPDIPLHEARNLVRAWLEGDKENKVFKDLVKLANLPDISAAAWAMKTEGRDDRVPVKTLIVPVGTGQNPYLSWKWRYAPGCDRKNRGRGPKLRALSTWLTEHQGEPLVVGCASVTTYYALCKLMEEHKLEYRAIRGGVPQKDRKRFIKEFQGGEALVMVLQQVAGSESVHLTRAAYSILVDHAPYPNVYAQFMGRTRRVGQDRECHHIDYVFGAYQRDRVSRIRLGEDFDSATRKQLEETLRAALISYGKQHG